MEPVYQGYCDIFYITKTLQKALKKVIKKCRALNKAKYIAFGARRG